MFDQISKAFASLFSRADKCKILSPAVVSDLLAPMREALIQADVSYGVVEAFCVELQNELAGVTIPGSVRPEEYIAKAVYERLVIFLGGKNERGGDRSQSFMPPTGSVIMVLGVQGSGKTTTLAKLGRFLLDAHKKNGKVCRILAGSVDFYRPAAVDQLEIVSGQAGIDFKRATERDPVRAAVELQRFAQENGYDYFLLDTAGRMHVDDQLIAELVTINGIVQPRYKILVLDSMTGQEALSVARQFDEKVGFSSAILTKTDSETRGGCAFSFRYELKKAILFVGTGEKITDLERFYPERAATQMLGMGDMMSLAERLDAQLRKEEQELLYRGIQKKDFTLEDFAQQLDMVSRIGSMGQLLRYLPGGSQLGVTRDQLEQGEQEIKKFRAVIRAMTQKERLVPRIINLSRKRRIALGAGVAVDDVERFLVRFEESRKMLKQFRRPGMF